MATVENQKTISIQKEKSDKEHLYSIHNLEAGEVAMCTLKGETFKLWYYLNRNQNGYTFGLSPKDALQKGIGSKSSYDRAVKELIEKGYLVNTKGNHYNFYELPPNLNEEIIITTCKTAEGFAF